MSIIKGPAMSVDASGNMGAICYTRWRGRQVARSAWSGTQTSSSSQLLRRAEFKLIVQRWGSGLVDRDAWNQFAREKMKTDRLGDPREWTGYELYVARNIVYRRHTDGYLDTPPKNTDGVVFVLSSLNNVSTGVLKLVCAVGAGIRDITQDFLVGWIAGPFNSEARRAIAPEFRYSSATQLQVYLYFSGLTIGKYYWVRWRWEGVKTGQIGPWAEAQGFVAI